MYCLYLDAIQIGKFAVNAELTISDVLTIISFIGVIVGVFVALINWYINLMYKHTERLRSLLEKQRIDNSIREILLMLDYVPNWYNIDFQRDESKRLSQQKLDATLTFYSYICYLKTIFLLNKKEFQFFEYDLNVIITNKGMLDYFYNLYHYTKNLGLDMIYKELFKYAQKKGVIPIDFYDERAYEKEEYKNKYHYYIHYLKSDIENDLLIKKNK